MRARDRLCVSVHVREMRVCGVYVAVKPLLLAEGEREGDREEERKKEEESRRGRRESKGVRNYQLKSA